jgi:hypothetical protein
MSISQQLSLRQFATFVGIFIEKETQITGGGGETKKNSHVAREQATNKPTRSTNTTPHAIHSIDQGANIDDKMLSIPFSLQLAQILCENNLT